MSFTCLQLLEENLINIHATLHISQSTFKYTVRLSVTAAVDVGMTDISPESQGTEGPPG